MTAGELSAWFGSRRLLVTVEGERLRVRGPVAEVAAVRALVAANKAALLPALANVCGGCSQGMTPTAWLAEGCAWPGCRHKGA